MGLSSEDNDFLFSEFSQCMNANTPSSKVSHLLNCSRLYCLGYLNRRLIVRCYYCPAKGLTLFNPSEAIENTNINLCDSILKALNLDRPTS